MSDSPKIQLSPFEERLVTDSEWLLTKNAILEKIRGLLSAVQDHERGLLNDTASFLPAEVMQTSGKITRGENYLGLPWLVLDQPRFFERENIFAVRTMFWWGRFFSTTLQLSGRYKERFCAQIGEGYKLLRENDFYVVHGESEWDHHFEEGNYRPVRDFDEEGFLRHLEMHRFIKVAKKISLREWDTIDRRLVEDFNIILTVLQGLAQSQIPH